MELKITRCRSHEGLRCPKCAAAISPADIRLNGLATGLLSIDCKACHTPILNVELEIDLDEGDDWDDYN